MIRISHRGNIAGKRPELENNPDYILKALSLGYDVEIDVWRVNNVFYLGHDRPQYEIVDIFLWQNHLWCHAKNIDALDSLLSMGIHCFSHEDDSATITSREFIWTHPTTSVFTSRSICLFPEQSEADYSMCAGVCSDYIGRYQ